MNDIKKFMFDLNDFDDDAIAKKQEEEENILPSFSEEELEAARAEGYQKGRIAGIDEERASLTQHIQNTMQSLVPNIQQLLAQEEQRSARFVDDSIALTHDALEKLFPQLHQKTHLDALKTYLKQTLTEQYKWTKLIISVHPDTEKEIANYIAQSFATENSEIRIIVQSGADTPLGHAHIQWDHGGALWTPLKLQEAVLENLISFLPDDYKPEENSEDATQKEIIQQAPPEKEKEKEDAENPALNIDENDKKAHNGSEQSSMPNQGDTPARNE